jgi:hypothetical protein
MSGPGSPQPPGWQPQQQPQGHQQPPPPAWQPQQQQQPPGWPQQQQPQQQQWSPHPPPPKKKSKAPKIILITVIVLVVLAGLGVAGWRFLYISGDAGADSASGPPPQQCAVDAKVLDAANVAAFTGGRTEESQASCGYAARTGGDGVTVRTVTVTVRTVPGVDTAEAEKTFSFFIAENNPNSTSKDGPQLGDMSRFYLYQHNDRTYLTLGIRKGTTLYKIGFYGYTKGFFGDTAAPIDQAEKDLTAMAQNIVK